MLFGLRDAGVASRLSFLSVAVWWVAFSIPLFRRVSEPAVTPDAAALAAGEPGARVVRAARRHAARVPASTGRRA